MRKIVIAGLMAGTVLFSATGAQAHPLAEHDPWGRLCSFASATDPQVENQQTGEINGGPLVIDEEETPEVEAGTMTCTIQVNASTHAGADACAITGPPSPAVVGAAGDCPYSAQPLDNVYLCTQVDIDGHAPLYWASSNDPLVPGSWSPSADAPCSLAISASTPGEEDPPFDTIHELELLIDSKICPILKELFPPEGDIVLPDPIGKIWDCPEYDA